MSLDLSLVLSPSQVEGFNLRVQASDSHLLGAEELEVSTLRQSYEAKRLEARRAILLELLGVPGHVQETEVSFTQPEEHVKEIPVSEPAGLTSREIAQALGYHKDSVNNWGRKGLLPTPIEGTGTHPHNPPRYILDLDELRTKVEAYQDAAKGVRDKAIQNAVARTATGLTRKQLAQRLGCDDTSVANYEKRGFITPIEGTGTGLKNPRLYRTSDIPGLKAKIKELQEKKGETISKVLAESRAKAQSAPTPKDEEIETPEIVVEPRPAPQLSEATKHDYHWRNALPVLEAAIEKAEAEGEAILEIAYQTSPDNYQDRGSFVARPFGQLGPGLLAFVRATQESGKWSLTVPLRVESWIKPMSEGLVSYWRDAAKVKEVATTPRLPLADSPMRSLQA